jgi:hypothetical protein
MIYNNLEILIIIKRSLHNKIFKKIIQIDIQIKILTNPQHILYTNNIRCLKKADIIMELLHLIIIIKVIKTIYLFNNIIYLI